MITRYGSCSSSSNCDRNKLCSRNDEKADLNPQESDACYACYDRYWLVTRSKRDSVSQESEVTIRKPWQQQILIGQAKIVGDTASIHELLSTGTKAAQSAKQPESRKRATKQRSEAEATEARRRTALARPALPRRTLSQMQPDW